MVSLFKGVFALACLLVKGASHIKLAFVGLAFVGNAALCICVPRLQFCEVTEYMKCLCAMLCGREVG